MEKNYNTEHNYEWLAEQTIKYLEKLQSEGSFAEFYDGCNVIYENYNEHKEYTGTNLDDYLYDDMGDTLWISVDTSDATLSIRIAYFEENDNQFSERLEMYPIPNSLRKAIDEDFTRKNYLREREERMLRFLHLK